MKFKRLIYGSLLSLSLFTTASLFSVVAATNGIQKVYTGKECLAAEFDKITGATSYTAYIKGEDITSYQQIDSQLVRVTDDKVRVDAVGLKAGTYSLKFESNNSNSFIELTDITVEADDRSGYAHYDPTTSDKMISTGIGAYNNNGTLKDNADVIYVTEATKNTVEYNGVHGLGNILHSSLSKPLAIRIIGTIGAPTWNEIDYRRDTNGTYNVGNTTVTRSGAKDYTLVIRGLEDAEKALGTQTYNQSELVGVYNTLDTSKYDELDGLDSKLIYDKGVYDSAWNMMTIDGNSNITVEGIGSDATIAQWGFNWKRCSSIEVKNLTFNDYPEDACSFENSSQTSNTDVSKFTMSNLWIHNNTFNSGNNNWDVSDEQDKHEGDGATDFKGLKNVTVSYNHYYNNHKTGLVGGDGTHHQANFTFHHNWYQANLARLPYGRQANMHMYNNFYDGTTDNNMQIHDGAYAFIENCYFKDIAKTFEVKKNKTTQAPAIKSYNSIYDNCSKDTGDYITKTDNRQLEVTNDNFVSSTFDIDSSLFYYENDKTDVTIMNSASELPTLIPNVAGAGKLNEYTTYSVIGEEEVVLAPVYDNTSWATYLNEDFSDSTMSITKTASTPTSAGLYYRITKKDSADIDSNEYNNVTINNNRVKVLDNSGDGTIGDGESRTTNAYYMFGTDKYFNSGIVKYSLEVEIPVNSKWKIISFINNSNAELALYSDVDKHLAIKYGDSVTPITTSAYTSGTYHIELEIDYSSNKLSLSVGNDKATITNYNSGTIKGLLFTTSAGGARTYYFDNVKIAVKDTLKLGYQLGSYTNNNTKYNALRIIGKIEFNDIYTNLDSIDSITMNIIIENANGVTTKTLNKDITDVYKSLKISDGTTITETGDNLRYYYSVIKGITSSYSGYKIKASTTLNLKNGVKVECSGFVYEIQ